MKAEGLPRCKCERMGLTVRHFSFSTCPRTLRVMIPPSSAIIEIRTRRRKSLQIMVIVN